MAGKDQSPSSEPAVFEWWYGIPVDGKWQRVGIVFATSLAVANGLAAIKFSEHENVQMICGWRCCEDAPIASG